jgi:hypothetical protein
MNRKRLLSSAVGALVAAAIAGGVAYATIPGPGNVYSACMLKGLGTIRLIDKSLPSTNLMTHSTDREIEISWNQAGQPGPQGAKGEPGAPGTNGTNGTNGADGKDGVSVTSESEPAGANCAEGGSKFTAANGITFACNGANGSSGAPWDIITTVLPSLGPGQNVQVTVPCPAGDVILGGSFDDPVSALSNSHPTAAGTGWFYSIDNGAGSGVIGPFTTHTYCGKS